MHEMNAEQLEGAGNRHELFAHEEDSLYRLLELRGVCIYCNQQ